MLTLIGTNLADHGGAFCRFRFSQLTPPAASSSELPPIEDAVTNASVVSGSGVGGGAVRCAAPSLDAAQLSALTQGWRGGGLPSSVELLLNLNGVPAQVTASPSPPHRLLITSSYGTISSADRLLLASLDRLLIASPAHSGCDSALSGDSHDLPRSPKISHNLPQSPSQAATIISHDAPGSPPISHSTPVISHDLPVSHTISLSGGDRRRVRPHRRLGPRAARRRGTRRQPDIRAHEGPLLGLL